MPGLSRRSRPDPAPAPPVAAATEDPISQKRPFGRGPPRSSQEFDEEDNAASVDVDVADDAAVADLFSTVLRWDFDALVSRAQASDGESDLDPLPLVFKDAEVSGSFHRNWRIEN